MAHCFVFVFCENWERSKNASPMIKPRTSTYWNWCWGELSTHIQLWGINRTVPTAEHVASLKLEMLCLLLVQRPFLQRVLSETCLTVLFIMVLC